MTKEARATRKKIEMYVDYLLGEKGWNEEISAEPYCKKYFVIIPGSGVSACESCPLHSTEGCLLEISR